MGLVLALDLLFDSFYFWPVCFCVRRQLTKLLFCFLTRSRSDEQGWFRLSIFQGMEQLGLTRGCNSWLQLVGL